MRYTHLKLHANSFRASLGCALLELQRAHPDGEAACREHTDGTALYIAAGWASRVDRRRTRAAQISFAESAARVSSSGAPYWIKRALIIEAMS